MMRDAGLGIERFAPPTLVEVNDAFVAETRGEGGTYVPETAELVLNTVRGVRVVVLLDTWTYYGAVWNARLEIPAQYFSVPLLEGPHVDAYQRPEDAIREAVEWLRKITNAQA